MNMLIDYIAGFLSGALGAMGMGGGGILIIYLTVFANIDQVKAQGINLIFFLPIALVAIGIYIKKKLICWKIVIPMSIMGIIGAIAGSYLSGLINPNILSKLFGILLLIIGLWSMFNKNQK